MTAGGDFVPAGTNNFDEPPNYPTVFGVRLTPRVLGILLPLLGALLSYGLWSYIVQPVYQQNVALKNQVREKEAQLVNQEEIRRQIADAQQRLVEAERLKADVLTLFADEDSLDTLLLDVNERVQSVNAGITDPDLQATLSKFSPTTPEPEIIADSSFGAPVNQVLQRHVYDVEMKGNFAQTQSIIRSIERLQPLLVVQNFDSQIDQDSRILRLDAQGRSLGSPIPRLTTAFQLVALMPASADAAPAAATPAAPGTAPVPGATPAPGTTPAPASPAAGTPAAPTPAAGTAPTPPTSPVAPVSPAPASPAPVPATSP